MLRFTSWRCCDYRVSLFVVYGLVGGIFDVSAMIVSQSLLEVLSTNGDTSLGGEDFDNVLLDHLISTFKRNLAWTLVKTDLPYKERNC